MAYLYEISVYKVQEQNDPHPGYRYCLKATIAPEDEMILSSLLAYSSWGEAWMEVIRLFQKLTPRKPEESLERKLARLIEIGRSLGFYEALRNRSISHDALQRACRNLFDERDQLIEEIKNTKNMTIQSHLQSYLEESMAGLRHESMDLFARELMIALRREGYHLEDILYGLSSHAYQTFDDERLTNFLEEATNRAKELRRQYK